jgi:hypothetical protein
MRKILLILIVQSVVSYSQAQTKPAVLTQKDSIDILKELMGLLDSAYKPTSYVFANVGIGNRLFSVRNNALNAKQSFTSTVIYTPSVGYYHKTGFSLIGGASLLNDGNGLGVSQYSVNPAFDLMGSKRFDVGISYTHYFVQDKFSSFSSPIQEDLFASFAYKKTWVRPGVSVGYSTGEYKEVQSKDTLIGNRIRHQYDSAINHLEALSMMVTLGHEFSWYGVFNKKDALAITPTFMGNAGSSTINITHKTNAPRTFFLTGKNKLPKFYEDKLSIQSVGLSIDVNYTIGGLTIQPQLYLDYYLPETATNRLSQVFTFNVGYAF